MSQATDRILTRAARELQSGQTVNLGIGLPTQLPRFLPPRFPVLLHSENGFVGMGPPLAEGTPDDPVIDAGGQACTLVPGAACFDSAVSFALVRGGRLDVAVLGAFEVSLSGDLANWKIPGQLTPGMGGGMELAQKARRVIVVSRHLDKQGQAKLVPSCSLPLTAVGCVDLLITEQAVFRRRQGQMMLISVFPEFTPEQVLAPIAATVPVRQPLLSWAEVDR